METTRVDPRVPSAPRFRWRSAFLRGLLLLALWMVLCGSPALGTTEAPGMQARIDLPDLIAGLIAAALAAWVSLRVAPPTERGASVSGMFLLLARVAWNSLRAGVDVAWRALAPQGRVRPGYFTFAPRASGTAERDALAALTSLVPGTLPVGMGADGSIRYHALDIECDGQPSLAADDAALARALRLDPAPLPARGES